MLSPELSTEFVSGAIVLVLTIALAIARLWHAKVSKKPAPEPAPPPAPPPAPVHELAPAHEEPEPAPEPPMSKEDLWVAYQLQRQMTKAGWSVRAPEREAEIPAPKKRGRPRKAQS